MLSTQATAAVQTHFIYLSIYVQDTFTAIHTQHYNRCLVVLRNPSLVLYLL